MNSPLISIIIPVKNGASWLKKLFDAYSRQTLAKEIEIIVIDSGSTDDSVAICNDHHAKVKQIPAGTFNHGLTRKLGVDISNGKYVLLTVQDAVPENENFLQELLNWFKDSEIAAVCGLQIVPVLPETSPFHWFRPVSKPEIRCYQFDEPGKFDKLSPSDKKSICSWDDVCAMYKRETLEAIPFRSVSFGEDMAWCKEALRAGYKICYNPNAKVFHYHLSEQEYLYKRNLTELYHFHKLFGFVPEKSNIPKYFIRALYLLMKEGRVPFFKKFTWLYNEMKDQFTVRKSTADFLKQLHKGNEALEAFHERICGIAPQAPAK